MSKTMVEAMEDLQVAVNALWQQVKAIYSPVFNLIHRIVFEDRCEHQPYLYGYDFTAYCSRCGVKL